MTYEEAIFDRDQAIYERDQANTRVNVILKEVQKYMSRVLMGINRGKDEYAHKEATRLLDFVRNQDNFDHIKEGAAFYLKGLPLDSCPYINGSSAKAQWVEEYKAEGAKQKELDRLRPLILVRDFSSIPAIHFRLSNGDSKFISKAEAIVLNEKLTAILKDV